MCVALLLNELGLKQTALTAVSFVQALFHSLKRSGQCERSDTLPLSLFEIWHGLRRRSAQRKRRTLTIQPYVQLT